MNSQTTEAMRQFWSVPTIEAAMHERVTVPACPAAWNDEHQEFSLTTLIGDTPLPAGTTVLDYGCGVGRTSRALLRRGVAVVGVDVSETMLTYAKMYCEEHPRFTTVLCDGFGCAAVASASVDGAVSAYCLQHMPTLDMVASVLREICRVLKSGGWFVTQSTDHGLPVVDAPAGFLGARQRLSTMLQLAEDAGFQLVRAAYPLAPGAESQYLISVRKP